MRGQWTCWLACGLALSLALASGCYSQNPSYFPYLLPTGRITQTHAKPPGHGYYANFDPYACRLEVRPLEASNAVGTQHVLIATIYDASGQPRRGRRVEWMLEGVGHIVEVDESGYDHGRGYKVDNRYAVSYTDYKEHVIDRGNNNPTDDFAIRPGQSWCVISSPVEGDTHVTVYAPEIHNWDKHKVNVTMHWINAGWTIAPPATNRTGTQHTFVTNIYRYTDRMPLANYRVRYTILDGPPAVFVPGQQRVVEAISDLQGNAAATIAQLQPQGGVNRIGVEIIRPPDPCCPTGPGIIIGRGETFKEWNAPSIGVTKVAPPAVAVGQPFTYTITVTNTGRVETDGLTVRDSVPEGITFQSANPPATREGRDLIWTLGPLGPGRSAAIQAIFRADRVGAITNTATAISAEGLQASGNATIQVTAPGLTAAMTGPPTGLVGVPVTYQISVTNTGNGQATNVVLTDQFDELLEHASGANPLQLEIGTLEAGENKVFPITLTPRREGQAVNRVSATADGGLAASAQHVVQIVQPRLTLTKTGPAVKYARSQAEWTLTVNNPGDVPLNNVVLRDQLPQELTFVQASDGGQLGAGNLVLWNLGSLQPRESRRVQLVTRAEMTSPRAVNVATVTADPGMSQRVEAAIEIRGIPTLRFEAIDTRDPVEVGDTTTYEMSVTNTGSLAANGIQITATLPPQMRFRSASGPNNVQPQREGNTLTFPPIDGLQPGQSFAYTIVAEALQAGDARFRAVLKSASLGPEPVVEEESTTIFRGVEPGAAPPAAGGRGGASTAPPATPPSAPPPPPP